jgi:hypothetical protein
MSVTVYRDSNYQGPFARIRPGFFSGQDLKGYYNRSAYGSGEDLDNAISSIRVGPNTIIALYGGQAPTASAGARVIVGPYDVPDLGVLGMGDKTSSIQVLPFREYDSGVPRSGGAVLYSGYAGGGRNSVLERGDYDAARLASEEVKFPNNQLRSLRVSPNVLAILYSGPDFDISMDAAVVAGPTMVDDLDRVGLLDRVSSIRIMYTDSYDFVYNARGQLTTRGAAQAAPPGGREEYPRVYESRQQIAAPAPLTYSGPRAGAGVGGSPGGTGGKEARQMWVMIFALFVIVCLLGAFVATRSWYGSAAARKVGGAALPLLACGLADGRQSGDAPP